MAADPESSSSEPGYIVYDANFKRGEVIIEAMKRGNAERLHAHQLFAGEFEATRLTPAGTDPDRSVVDYPIILPLRSADIVPGLEADLFALASGNASADQLRNIGSAMDALDEQGETHEI